MPSHDRLKSDDRDGADDGWKYPKDKNEKQAIQTAQNEALGHLPAKNSHLMANDPILGIKASA